MNGKWLELPIATEDHFGYTLDKHNEAGAKECPTGD
jgi:hypothetical protein